MLENLDAEQAAIRLESNQLVMLPASTLIKRDDGNYEVGFSLKRFQEEGVIVIPVVEEHLNVDKRQVERGVRITKTVRTEDVVVDEPLHREDIDVERVMINRYVDDDALPVRYDGDTMIIPLVEEVLVVEKRRLLREEIHIKRQKRTVNNPQVHTLRHEEVQVEREDETQNP